MSRLHSSRGSTARRKAIYTREIPQVTQITIRKYTCQLKNKTVKSFHSDTKFFITLDLHLGFVVLCDTLIIVLNCSILGFRTRVQHYV